MPLSPTPWNCADCRAVVPPSELENVRDVVFASYDHAKDSPSPIGMGFYGYHSNDTENRVPLSILYVSPAVVKDRAKFLKNGGGVHSGWYLIAEPGMAFTIQVSVVNELPLQVPGKDCCRISLDLDGKESAYKCNFSNRESVFTEVVVDGFLTSCAEVSPGILKREKRRFQFRKAITTEGHDGHATQSDLGLIRLRRANARRVKREGFHHFKADRIPIENKIHEKAVAKEGKSISISAHHTRVTRFNSVSSYSTVDIEEVPDATLTIHIRELKWMSSRRLVDDEGTPLTFEKYQDLLKSDEKEVKAEKRLADSVTVVNVKRQKRSCDCRKKATEVIDLT